MSNGCAHEASGDSNRCGERRIYFVSRRQREGAPVHADPLESQNPEQARERDGLQAFRDGSQRREILAGNELGAIGRAERGRKVDRKKKERPARAEMRRLGPRLENRKSPAIHVGLRGQHSCTIVSANDKNEEA